MYNALIQFISLLYHKLPLKLLPLFIAMVTRDIIIKRLSLIVIIVKLRSYRYTKNAQLMLAVQLNGS